MRCLVTYPFFVRKGGRIYEAGEVFEGAEAKVASLVRRGLAEPCEGRPGAEAGGGTLADDLPALTVAELKALCDERGLGYPKKATKAQLLLLLAD